MKGHIDMTYLTEAVGGSAARIARQHGILIPGLATIAMAFVLAAGCSNGSSNINNSLVKSINVYVPPPGTALPNGAITLYANSTFLTGSSTTQFGQVANAGGYASITSGTYNLVMSGPTVQPAVQLNAQTFAGSNAAYTVLGAGESGQTGTLAPQIIVAPNYVRNELALTTGTAAIRVINASLNANSIGLYSTSNGGAPTTPLATATASVPFGYSAAINVYEAIPTSTIAQLTIVDSTAPTIKLGVSGGSNLNSFAFKPGDAYTLIVYGQPGNGTVPLGCTWVQDYPAP